MKLKYIRTTVHIQDTETRINWIVEFTGKRTDLHGKVFKNGEYVLTYSPAGGHANKTMALHIIKNTIEHQLK